MKLLFAICLLAGFQSWAWDVMNNQFLSFGEAEKLWNIEPFDSSRFKDAKPDDRGGMALDLINRGTFNNQKLIAVKKALGKPDGKFQTRGSLVYQLGSDDKNSYQLIFLPDFSGKTVENIKIYHQPIETTPPAEPIPTTSGISAGSKRLPIAIDGSLAESIYHHLKVVESKFIKTGKNIACSKSANRYHCSFEIDEKGEAFAR